MIRRAPSTTLAHIEDSSEQLESFGEPLAPSGQLTLGRGIYGARHGDTDIGNVFSAQEQGSDGHPARLEDEVVGPGRSELQLRFLDREQVLDGLGRSAVAVLERRVDLAELVVRDGERQPPVDIDLQRL